MKINKFPPQTPEVLAHWRYAPEQWRDFAAHERELKRFDVSEALSKHFHVTFAGVAFLTVIGALGGGLAGFLVAGLLVAIFFGFAVGIHKLMQAVAQRNIEASPGEVLITRDGVTTNGMWFGWGPRDATWRLRVVRRETVPVGAGRTMEVLEFKCVGYAYIRGSRVPIDKEWRVPVPAGREREADALVTRLLAAQQLKEGDPLSPANALSDGGASGNLYGHAFAGDVCSRCGNTVEAVTHFKWPCRGRG